MTRKQMFKAFDNTCEVLEKGSDSVSDFAVNNSKKVSDFFLKKIKVHKPVKKILWCFKVGKNCLFFAFPESKTYLQVVAYLFTKYKGKKVDYVWHKKQA